MNQWNMLDVYMMVLMENLLESIRAIGKIYEVK
jgi:hypothetical protein